MGIARWHLMDLGTGKWWWPWWEVRTKLEIQEIFFVAHSGRTEFGGKNKEILGIKDGDNEGGEQVLFFAENLNWEQRYCGSLGNLLKLF